MNNIGLTPRLSRERRENYFQTSYTEARRSSVCRPVLGARAWRVSGFISVSRP